MIELAQEFGFEAAHSLARRIDAEASRRIHGHSYGGVLVLRGEADPETGMLVDLGHVERAIAAVRAKLDHRLLDEVEGLGAGDDGEPGAVDLRGGPARLAGTGSRHRATGEPRAKLRV